MKYKILLLYALMILLFPISGSIRTTKLLCRYVTEAELTFYQPDRYQTMHYQDPGKISSLLTCLRLAAPYGQVKTAEPNPNAHHYRICLHYSDRSQQVYHLQDYRYFSDDGITWQKVNPETAHYLYLLLHLLPGDS